MTNLTYTIEFLSDWHIGSGGGISGSVDRLMIRDTNGLPFVPAKTMTGIWRDAAERLAVALNSQDDSGWTNFVSELFGDQPSIESSPGTPRSARVHIRPAHYSQKIKEVTDGLSSAESVGIITTIRTTTAIDSTTGTASAHTLRSSEMGRAGSSLSGIIELDPSVIDDEVVRDSVVMFLSLAAGLIDVVGGKRRRGAGRCTVTLESDGHPVTIDATRVPQTAPSLPNGAHDASKKVPAGSRPLPVDAADFHTLDIDIETLLPVIIPRGTFGNVVDTADHLTGRHVLAAICGLLRIAGIDGDGMVSAGTLFVSAAQPIESDLRCLPTPFALSKAKHSFRSNDDSQDSEVINTLFPRSGDTQYKQMRGGWIAVPATADTSRVSFRSVDVSRIARTHATISDGAQRPTSDIGGVFTYQAIAPGQTFRTQIAVRAGDDERQHISDVLDGAITAMGTSRKDDFGRVRLSTATGWNAMLVSSDSRRHGWEPGSTITLLCTSDVVLLDENLRPTTSIEALKRTFAESLNVGVDALDVDADGVRVRGQRLDSWNATWGLPHSTLLTIAAGSTIRFNVLSSISAEKVAEIETLGIGERRAAGFGRVILDHPVVTVDRLELADQALTVISNSTIGLRDVSSDGSSLIEAMQAAWWARWISSNLDNRINSLIEILKIGGTSSTQLNQLRSILLGDRRVGEDSGAMRWLNRPMTTKRWNSTTVDHLKAAIETPKSVLDTLFPAANESASPGDIALATSIRPPEQLATEALILFLEKASRNLTRTRARTSEGV